MNWKQRNETFLHYDIDRIDVHRITKMLQFFILCTLISMSVCKKCDKESSVVVKNPEFMSNGDIKFENVEYKRTEYFFENNTLNVCVCAKKTCVPKCCPPGYGLRVKNMECVTTDSIFDPPIHDEYMRYPHSNDLQFITRMLTCTNPGEFRVIVTDFTDVHFLKPVSLFYFIFLSTDAKRVLLYVSRRCVCVCECVC